MTGLKIDASREQALHSAMEWADQAKLSLPFNHAYPGEQLENGSWKFVFSKVNHGPYQADFVTVAVSRSGTVQGVQTANYPYARFQPKPTSDPTVRSMKDALDIVYEMHNAMPRAGEMRLDKLSLTHDRFRDGKCVHVGTCEATFVLYIAGYRFLDVDYGRSFRFESQDGSFISMTQRMDIAPVDRLPIVLVSKERAKQAVLRRFKGQVGAYYTERSFDNAFCKLGWAKPDGPGLARLCWYIGNGPRERFAHLIDAKTGAYLKNHRGHD